MAVRKRPRAVKENPGDRAIRFICKLKQIDGPEAGQPIRLRKWQAAIIRRFFGTIDPKTGRRKYRTLYLEIPRKNGKSTLIAAIAIYLLVADGEFSAQVYGIANDKDQAGIVFEAAMKMVLLCPWLRRMLNLRIRDKVMEDMETMSFYKALSKLGPNKHGLNTHALLVDEYHTITDNEVFDVLSTSQSARRQPVRIIITTAGKPKHKGVPTPAYTMHKYAMKVLASPDLDPRFLPIIYAAAPEDDPHDPKVWQKANPALDDFKFRETLEDLSREAKEIPAQLNVLRQLDLNIWVEDAKDKAFTQLLWDANKGTWIADDRIPDFLLGRECYAGLDLASTSDICALVLVFPPDRDADGKYLGPFHIVCRFWVPGMAIEKRTTSELPYRRWAQAGFLKITPGNVADYDFIRADIMGKESNGVRTGGLMRQVRIKEIAYDSWNSSQLVNDLVSDGAQMVEFRQGPKSYHPPIKEVLRLATLGQLSHGAQPVLAWMATNLVFRRDANDNFAPDKRESDEKIDGMAALFMAFGRILSAEPTFKSRWSNPGGKRTPTADDVAAEAAARKMTQEKAALPQS